MGKKRPVNKKIKIPVQKLNELFRVEDLSPYKDVLIKDVPFNKRVQNKMQENNCRTLEELLNYSATEILKFNNLGKGSVDHIFKTLKEYLKVEELRTPEADNVQSESYEPDNLKELAELIIQTICKGKHYFEVLLGRANGRVLKSIGNDYGCTRERIRQVEVNAVKKFSNLCYFKVQKFLTLMKQEIGERRIITLDDLIKATDKNTAKIFLYLFSKSNWQKEFTYDRIANTIIIEKGIFKAMNYEEAISHLPDCMFEEELQAELDRISNGEKAIADSLRARVALKYRQTGKFWHKHWLPLNFHCGYILKKYFKDGYKIFNEEDYNKFIKFLQEIFGENIYLTHRALDAKISTYVGVLCKRGKYIHPDYLHIPPEILEEIKNFIDNSNRNALLYKEIFEVLKEKLAGTQITNHYFLQGIMKFYKMPYILKKDRVAKKADWNFISEFNSYIKERGEVSLKELENYFVGLDYSNIMLSARNSPEVIFIGNGYYLHCSKLNLQEKDFADMEPAINDLCQKSPVTSRFLLYFFKEHFSDFLSRNNIATSDKLFGILQYMFSKKFNFSRPYIFANNLSQITHKAVLLQYFADADRISIEQLLKFCEENKIRYIAKNYLIENLKPEFIRIDDLNLSRPEKIGITDKVISEVIEVLNDKIEQNGGWQSARVFKNYELLPKLEVEWNSFLLESVVELSNKPFKVLHTSNSTGKYSSAIFVEKDFAEDKIEDFLLKVLLAAHKRRNFKTYAEILNWLKEKGFCHSAIPRFLFLKNHLSSDKTGKITLK